jgi:hypothetical protein
MQQFEEGYPAGWGYAGEGVGMGRENTTGGSVMHYTDYAQAVDEAQAFTNDEGVSVRVIAFDYTPFFESEEPHVEYAHVNTECTLEEMRHAGYKNARVCLTIHPHGSI